MMKKTMGVVVALGCLNLALHAAPRPKVVLHVESQGDARFAPHQALFYDVAARQLATQWVCVRSEAAVPLRADRVAEMIATNGAAGLLLLRAESLVFSDTANSSFVMRGATSSRLYTFKGTYVAFDPTGQRLAEGPLRATQMSFALTGLDVVSDSFISQIFGQAVNGFVRALEQKPLNFVQAAGTHTVAEVSLPRGEEKAAAVKMLERPFVEVPNVTPADLPQPVIKVEPVPMTIACTPCNLLEQAIFLPDIRLVDQHRLRKLTQRLPVQVACAVEVDGVIVGVAPLQIALEPGDHRIRFEHDGFVTFASTFTVKEAGHLVFPLRMDEQGFKRWTLSVRVFQAIETESVLQDAELQMIKREVRRLHGSGIRLDTSRLDDETARTSLYRLGAQK